MRTFATEIRWGVYFTGMTLGWMLMEKLTGLHSTHIDRHATLTNLVAIPAIALYVFALRSKRDNDLGGTMSYRQALVSGAIISAVVMVLSPLTQLITSKVITPDYFPNAIAHVVATGQMSQEAAEGYFNLKNYIVQGLIGAPVMGLLTTAIVGLFVKKA